MYIDTHFDMDGRMCPLVKKHIEPPVSKCKQKIHDLICFCCLSQITVLQYFYLPAIVAEHLLLV